MTREQIQKDACDVLLSSFSSAPNSRVGLDISMGVGKTLICLNYLYESAFNGDVLVVAPKRAIQKTWMDECIKHGMPQLQPMLNFTTYLSLKKIDLSKYQLIILDECHNLLFSHGANLNKYKGPIIGISGTPPKRQQSEKGKMVEKYCPIKFRFHTDDAVDNGILNDYQIIVHVLDLDTRKNFYQESRKGGYYTSEAATYSYWTNAIENASPGKDAQMKRILRMKAMMTFPSKDEYAKQLFNYIQDKVILFANTKEQASKLCQHSFISGNKDSDANLILFKEGKITKLSCVLQLNEGINIPDLKQGIIMHAYGNERKSAQRLGRILRLNPNETGIIHILCYDNTVDVTWVKSALEAYDQSKIRWVKKKIL
jgi:superfamily II DNA or RNA helicase